jgi:hypothetical protein
VRAFVDAEWPRIERDPDPASGVVVANTFCLSRPCFLFVLFLSRPKK